MQNFNFLFFYSISIFFFLIKRIETNLIQIATATNSPSLQLCCWRGNNQNFIVWAITLPINSQIIYKAVMVDNKGQKLFEEKTLFSYDANSFEFSCSQFSYFSDNKDKFLFVYQKVIKIDSVFIFQIFGIIFNNHGVIIKDEILIFEGSKYSYFNYIKSLNFSEDLILVSFSYFNNSLPIYKAQLFGVLLGIEGNIIKKIIFIDQDEKNILYGNYHICINKDKLLKNYGINNSLFVIYEVAQNNMNDFYIYGSLFEFDTNYNISKTKHSLDSMITDKINSYYNFNCEYMNNEQIVIFFAIPTSINYRKLIGLVLNSDLIKDKQMENFEFYSNNSYDFEPLNIMNLKNNKIILLLRNMKNVVSFYQKYEYIILIYDYNFTQLSKKYYELIDQNSTIDNYRSPNIINLSDGGVAFLFFGIIYDDKYSAIKKNIYLDYIFNCITNDYETENQKDLCIKCLSFCPNNEECEDCLSCDDHTNICIECPINSKIFFDENNAKNFCSKSKSTKGYYFNEKDGIYRKCSENCNDCKDNKFCNICQDGYFIKNNECSKCKDPCIEKEICESCKTCKDENICLSCYSSTNRFYDSKLNSIFCSNSKDIIGYYIDNGVYKKCSENCNECTNSNNCLTCINRNFTLIDGECQKCNIDKICIENEICSECMTCERHLNKCIECIDQKSNKFYDLKTEKVFCSNKFTDETYYNEFGIFKKCSLNCNKCLDYSNCLRCKDGHFLENNTCEKCENICIQNRIENCEECKNCLNSQNCSECNGSSVLVKEKFTGLTYCTKISNTDESKEKETNDYFEKFIQKNYSNSLNEARVEYIDMKLDNIIINLKNLTIKEKIEYLKVNDMDEKLTFLIGEILENSNNFLLNQTRFLSLINKKIFFDKILNFQLDEKFYESENGIKNLNNTRNYILNFIGKLIKQSVNKNETINLFEEYSHFTLQILDKNSDKNLDFNRRSISGKKLIFPIFKEFEERIKIKLNLTKEIIIVFINWNVNEDLNPPINVSKIPFNQSLSENVVFYNANNDRNSSNNILDNSDENISKENNDHQDIKNELIGYYSSYFFNPKNGDLLDFKENYSRDRSIIHIPLNDRILKILTNTNKFNDLREKNINILDTKNDFYNNRCFIYSDKIESIQYDLTLKYRRNKIFPNITIFCGNNCTFFEIDLKNYTKCICYDQYESRIILKKFIFDYISEINIDIIQCLRSLNFESVRKNIIFIVCSTLFFLIIHLIFIYKFTIARKFFDDKFLDLIKINDGSYAKPIHEKDNNHSNNKNDDKPNYINLSDIKIQSGESQKFKINDKDYNSENKNNQDSKEIENKKNDSNKNILENNLNIYFPNTKEVETEVKNTNSNLNNEEKKFKDNIKNNISSQNQLVMENQDDYKSNNLFPFKERQSPDTKLDINLKELEISNSSPKSIYDYEIMKKEDIFQQDFRDIKTFFYHMLLTRNIYFSNFIKLSLMDFYFTRFPLFFLDFSLLCFFNAILYTDEIIAERSYYLETKNMLFINNQYLFKFGRKVLKTIISIIIKMVPILFLKLLVKCPEDLIKEFRTLLCYGTIEEIRNAYKNIIKKMRFRIIIFFVFSSTILIFSWIYLIIFSIIYPSTSPFMFFDFFVSIIIQTFKSVINILILIGLRSIFMKRKDKKFNSLVYYVYLKFISKFI